MKKHITSALGFIALLVCTGCATHSFRPTAWEYKTFEIQRYPVALGQELNKLAQEGWDVVSVSAVPYIPNGIPTQIVVAKRLRKN